MSKSTNIRQIRLERHSPSYWRVTSDLPPLNIFGPQETRRMEGIIKSLDSDDRVEVVVFDSEVERVFLTHYDFLAKLEKSTALPAGPTGLQSLPDMLARLSRARAVPGHTDFNFCTTNPRCVASMYEL
jgi:enoyl-CoA hydratase/carnithine racemase